MTARKFATVWRFVTSTFFSAFFILAHQPSGKPVYINAEQIDFIGPADPNWDGTAAGSRVMVYGIWVAVKEKPDEIKTAIDKVLKQEQ